MPTALLPASAAAFAPRGNPNVVLGRKVEQWLTLTLKRVNRVKRPLNNPTQHTRCLTETLSSPNAIWTLCSLMFPKAPDSELQKDENPLVEAMFNYQMIHIEAYVVHVDMVSQNEVAFKLTPETIESLVDFHKDIFSVDTAASTWDWPEKETQLKKLQAEFVQSANKFIYRTKVQALEGMEEDGAGELLGGRSEDAKTAILNLFVPLLPPPPPRLPDVVRPPLLPSSTIAEDWWSSPVQQPVMPVEAWKVVPSSPSPVSSCDGAPNMWTTMSMSMAEAQLPSPAPSFSQPYTTAPYDAVQYYSAPVTMAALAALPLPSMLIQPCSTAASMNGFGGGFGGYPERYQEFPALSYGTTM
ncbi:uncharacterized protein BHQ10_000364 [Talaromyces amestolkiae]|uniref:Uncharacterized protein n=1 Tax=Talaromyces amestolkiae TaxID=1196081 RepID=A0A364KLD5_TALAM|nr:uncharacterized protein BHQ10_000364 [Talaromyces amestolkiae]RAO64352.1 hypothetical protein BHQ10_000364 [Talaromyces amestolkiae]